MADAPETDFSALVLAAGAGTRFGGGKLMAPWRGRPLVEHALEAARAAPAAEIVLVVGADARVGPCGAAWAERTGAALRAVDAADHAEGLSASLRAGLRAVPAGRGAFVFLGDMPEVPHDIAGKLAAAVRAGAPAAAPTFNGVRGHPALLGPALVTRSAELGGDRGARHLLQGLGERLALIPSGPGVRFDVDRPSDLDRP